MYGPLKQPKFVESPSYRKSYNFGMKLFGWAVITFVMFLVFAACLVVG